MRFFFLIFCLALAALGPLRAAEITPENFANAAAYSRSHGGLALRVEVGGRLVAESYYPGFFRFDPP